MALIDRVCSRTGTKVVAALTLAWTVFVPLLALLARAWAMAAAAELSHGEEWRSSANRPASAQSAPAARKAQYQAAPGTRPILRIWTSENCGPCRQFWQDYYGDKSFRDAIDRVYLVRSIIEEEHPIAAFFNGVLQHTPAFVCRHWNICFCGYTGKQQLLCRLGLLNGTAAVAPATQGGSLPDPAAAGDGPVSQSIPPTYGPSAAAGPSRASVPSIADIAGKLDGLEGILQDLQKALAAAPPGVIDPRVVKAVNAINVRLNTVDELKATLEGVKANVPAPIAQEIEAALGKLAPSLAPAIGGEVAKLLPAAGAALPAVAAALPLFGPWGAAAGAALAIVGGLGGWLLPKLFGASAGAVPAAGGQSIDLAAIVRRVLTQLDVKAGASPSAPSTQTAQGGAPLVVQTPPPPQQITEKTTFVPYQTNPDAEAFAWAKAELAKMGDANTVKTLSLLDSLMGQYGKPKA